jgi:hypothetical protein
VSFRQDNRGVSELIGFILLFGFLIILISIWQAQAVPLENKEVEIEHYLEAQEDMSELRSDFLDAAESGTTRSVSIRLGTTYPPRILFVNGPPPQGRISTEMPSNSTITADGFNVSSICGLDSPTNSRFIKLDTDYQHLSDSQAPAYRYENTLLYRQTPDGTVLYESNQRLIQNSTINIYPLTSNFSRAGVRSTAIDFSGSETGVVTVQDSVSLTIPTDLSDEQWGDLLKNEPNFQSTEQISPRRVKIELSDTVWKVRCAAVGAKGIPDVETPQPKSEQPIGNGSGAFRIDWQDPSTEEGTQPTCNAENCVWDVSSDTDGLLNLTASTTPLLDGMTVHFAANDTSVATITPSDGRTDSNGNGITSLDAQANGTVAIYVGTGGTSDVINITLTGVGQGSGDTAASQVEYVSGSGSAARAGGESRVDFDIRNTGDSNVRITEIEIESNDGSLVSIREDNGGSDQPGQHEIYIDSTIAGIYEASGDIAPGQDSGTNGYQLGTRVSLTQEGTLNSDEPAQVTLLDFRNPGGQPVSAADKPITVTIYFEDNSEVTFTFTPPGY